MTSKTINKSFRLYDFRVADVDSVSESESESESDSETGSGLEKAWADKKMQITMFGINEKGETAALIVDDYAPFFYIKVAPSWTEKQRVGLLEHIKRKVGYYYSRSITRLAFENHKDLYGFSAGPAIQFARIEFTNAQAMNKVRNLWFDEPREGEERRQPKDFVYERVKLELFESNIPPLLRYFHIYEISPSGWVSVPVKQVRVPTVRTTTCKYEYLCKVTDIRSQLEKESAAPYNICSYDIEASSSHGDFPMAKKSYKRLAMQLVDTALLRIATMGAKVDCAALIKKAVSAALGVGRCEGVDLVYPKRAGKWFSAGGALVEAALLESLQGVLCERVDMETASAAGDTIHRYFSAFPDRDNEGEGEDGEGEQGGEAEEEEDDEDDRPTPVKTPTKVAEKSGPTVAELLQKADVTRNQKIEIVTDVLGRHLPCLEGDQVTYIGSTFLRYGSKTPYRASCLVLGPVGSCSPVEGVEIACFESERDLLLAWTALMGTADPDIIIGYNIFGFDYEFMFQRAQECGCAAEFLMLSRLRGHVASGSKGRGPLQLDSKKIVIASGPFDMRFPDMVGRFQIDLYTYFRREFSLSSYKLDDVAMEFICDKVSRVSCDADAGETTLYSRNLSGVSPADYVHLEIVGYTTDYFRDGAKFSVKRLDAAAGTLVLDAALPEIAELIAAKKTVKWGLSKDDVSPQDIFRMTRGTPDERARVAKYCIQDCNIVQQLFIKIDVLTSYSEMSRICHVPMSYLVFRGQGIKLTSCLAKFCRMRGTLMPDLTARPQTGSNAGGGADYEGAIVLPPKCGIYMDDPVSCNDYSSLYPSIIISNNLSQDSKIWTKEFDLEGRLVRSESRNAVYDNLPGHRYIEIEFDRFVRLKGGKKKVIGKTVCRWAQFPDERRGVIPAILETILKARKTTRKQAEAETDDFMKNILDKRQLAYKVTANSIYGQCGSKTSTFYDKDIAASTTAVGRKMIIFAKTMLEDTYGDRLVDHPKHGLVRTAAEYVYGDTDSVFMTFHLTDGVTGDKIRGDAAMELTVEFSQNVARLCTENLERPMELSYEKTFKVMALLSKKRYAGLICEEDIHKLKLKIMGLSLKRRDNCDYLKDVYGGVLDCFLFLEGTASEKVTAAIQFLQTSLQNLLQGRISVDKLTVTKALRDYYKNPQQIAHAVLAARIGARDPGNRPRPGDRISYVFINHAAKAGEKLLQGDCIETPEFVAAANLKLNYHYYVTNQLMKPLLQLLGLAVEDILRALGKKGEVGRYRQSVAQLLKESGGDLELFEKHREKLATGIVQTHLFDPVLQGLSNSKKGLQTLSSLWGRGA